jgi:DNA-binding transcriptional LysR family regulator
VAQRSFSLALRESQEALLLPALAARLSAEGPNVELAAVRIERRDLEDELQSGELDAAIDVALPLSADVRREALRAEPLVVLARQGHPLISGEIDIERYLSLDHILVTGRRRGGGYEDVALGRLGMARRVRMRCQQHAAACEIVRRTDLVVTMPRSQAVLVNARTHNQMLDFPAQIPHMEQFLYWHGNADVDPAAQWFRKLLLAVARGE